jgi:hypothetical protein
MNYCETFGLLSFFVGFVTRPPRVLKPGGAELGS